MIVKFFYSEILKREYPLIRIPKNPSYTRPYARSFPEAISLSFSSAGLKWYGITEDNIDMAMTEILTHEYLHIILWRINMRAGIALNLINGWNANKGKVTWKLWKTKKKEDGYVWETTEGES